MMADGLDLNELQVIKKISQRLNAAAGKLTISLNIQNRFCLFGGAVLPRVLVQSLKHSESCLPPEWHSAAADSDSITLNIQKRLNLIVAPTVNQTGSRCLFAVRPWGCRN
jgi:hypothetical protein